MTPDVRAPSVVVVVIFGAHSLRFLGVMSRTSESPAATDQVRTEICELREGPHASSFSSNYFSAGLSDSARPIWTLSFGMQTANLRLPPSESNEAWKWAAFVHSASVWYSGPGIIFSFGVSPETARLTATITHIGASSRSAFHSRSAWRKPSPK